MGYTITGRLKKIGETQQVSERFTKREFVVEIADNPKYPQAILMQITGDRIDQLDAFRVGDDVEIEFSLRGREWRSPRGEVKYFNSLDAKTIEHARTSRSVQAEGQRRQEQASPSRQRRDSTPPPPDGEYGAMPESEELPF